MNRRTLIAAAAALTGGLGGRAARASAGDLSAAEFAAGRRFAETRFGRIAYVEQGLAGRIGGPAAVFLHGFPLNGFQWRGALPRLAGIRRCIAIDSMGLGWSEVPEGQDLHPAAQAEMVVAVLDALGIDRADLVANDSGGAIAQITALRHPGRVRSLLLTNCDVPVDDTPDFAVAVASARANLLADKWVAPQLADKRLARSPKGLGTLAYSRPANLTSDAIDVYFTPLVSSPLRKAQLHGYTIALEHNPLAGMEAEMARCQVPLRVVWGMADRFFKTSDADWLDRTWPGSRGVRRVEGAKLFWPEEQPGLIAEEARRFWGKVGA